MVCPMFMSAVPTPKINVDSVLLNSIKTQISEDDSSATRISDENLWTCHPNKQIIGELRMSGRGLLNDFPQASHIS